MDSEATSYLEKNILKVLEQEPPNIIFDLKNLGYLSIAGLRFFKTTKERQHIGNTFVLCSMPDYVRELFEISGFDNFLFIAPTMEDALKHF